MCHVNTNVLKLNLNLNLSLYFSFKLFGEQCIIVCLTKKHGQVLWLYTDHLIGTFVLVCTFSFCWLGCQDKAAPEYCEIDIYKDLCEWDELFREVDCPATCGLCEPREEEPPTTGKGW